MATLFIVSTPIGNLKDISLRAIEILKGVDLILCEDTRITKTLLEHYEIKTPLLSYHQHSKLKKVNYILNLLKQGKNLSLVSDAGTPGISDPGNKLIKAILEESYFPNQQSLIMRIKNAESFQREIKIVPIPGPSALVTAASISGFAMDKFIFLGFPPTKRKRKKFFEEVVRAKYPVIFYESPYRIIKTLNELRIMNQELRIVVCRELTKKFETIYRGKIEGVINEIKKDKARGEFAVIVEGKK